MKKSIIQSLEYAIYGLIPRLLVATYFLASFVLNQIIPPLIPARYSFGFFPFMHLGILGFVAVLAPIILVLFRPETSDNRLIPLYERCQTVLFSRRAYLTSFALFSMTIFFLLRNNFLNHDAMLFKTWFAEYIPTYGSFVTLDEMWEFYIHSRFWYYANELFGTSISLSYQLLSSLSGGIFVLLLLLYSRNVFPEKPFSFFLIVVSGGYMQLFFGDVENYTMAAVMVMAYFFSSHLYLQRRCRLLFPSIALTVASTFHLLTGFLMPSLLYLYLIALKRKEYLAIIIATISSVVVFALTLAFFHYHYRPIGEFLAMSHVFGYWGPLSKKIVEPTLSYYGQLINMQMLLFPISIFGILLVIFGRVRYEAFNTHLLISCISMLLFFYLFKAAIGVYHDWNLFAIVGIPISMFSAYNLLRNECSTEQRTSWGVCIYLFSMNSYCWIVCNHLLGCQNHVLIF